MIFKHMLNLFINKMKTIIRISLSWSFENWNNVIFLYVFNFDINILLISFALYKSIKIINN